jgi:hypothetical protein
LLGTPSYERSRRARYKLEAFFAELKEHMRLRQVRLRRLCNVAEQFSDGGHSPKPETIGARSCPAAVAVRTQYCLKKDDQTNDWGKSEIGK